VLSAGNTLSAGSTLSAAEVSAGDTLSGAGDVLSSPPGGRKIDIRISAHTAPPAATRAYLIFLLISHLPDQTFHVSSAYYCSISGAFFNRRCLFFIFGYTKKE
jgi:hypothetical protein